MSSFGTFQEAKEEIYSRPAGAWRGFSITAAGFSLLLLYIHGQQFHQADELPILASLAQSEGPGFSHSILVEEDAHPLIYRARVCVRPETEVNAIYHATVPVCLYV